MSQKIELTELELWNLMKDVKSHETTAPETQAKIDAINSEVESVKRTLVKIETWLEKIVVDFEKVLNKDTDERLVRVETRLEDMEKRQENEDVKNQKTQDKMLERIDSNSTKLAVILGGVTVVINGLGLFSKFLF